MKKLFVLLFPFVAFSQFNITKFQQEFTKAFNDYRALNNLSALPINANANSSAKIQSDYLISTYHLDTVSGKITGKIGHGNPDSLLGSPFLRLKQFDPTLDPSTSSIGENVLILSGYDAYNLVDVKKMAAQCISSWKKSIGHDLNLKSERSSFGINVSHITVTVPYTDYEVDVATLGRKAVTKYQTLDYYAISLVLIGEPTYY